MSINAACSVYDNAAYTIYTRLVVYELHSIPRPRTTGQRPPLKSIVIGSCCCKIVYICINIK